MRMTSLGLVGLLLLAGCSSEPTEPPTAAGSQAAVSPAPAPSEDQPDESSDGLYPDVVAATATQTDEGVWSFTATLSSPYDSPERYADAWRVVAPDGTELGVRELAHDHAGEQPFTRSLAGVEIPAGIDVVVVQGRDQINGWGGESVEVALAP